MVRQIFFVTFMVSLFKKIGKHHWIIEYWEVSESSEKYFTQIGYMPVPFLRFLFGQSFETSFCISWPSNYVGQILGLPAAPPPPFFHLLLCWLLLLRLKFARSSFQEPILSTSRRYSDSPLNDVSELWHMFNHWFFLHISRRLMTKVLQYTCYIHNWGMTLLFNAEKMPKDFFPDFLHV